MFSRKITVVFLFSMAKNSVNLSKNYYKILQVDAKCDQKVLKNSYLKLVKTLHPDVNPNGKEKFTQVQEAYEILSDKQLKTYYDQNNHFNNHSSQSTSSKKQTHSAQSRSKQSQTGHTYYQHRAYASQNPHDYFYNHNQYTAQTNRRKQKKDQYESEQNQQYQKKSTNFNKQQKYARSQASWQEFQRRKQYEDENQFRHQTPEERKMRDKLKAMRGFTSSYNVMWGRHHIRHNDITNSPFDADRKRQQEIRKLMPEKVRNFYDKLMDKIQEIAKK